MSTDFVVDFYGVRGSTPCSCSETARYGGNTSCVVATVAGHPIILDLGTGLRYFGHQVLADSSSNPDGSPFTGTVLVSHLHWDHIQGLPFFVPILTEGTKLALFGPPQESQSLKEAICSFIKPPLFPVALEVLPGTVDFSEVSSAEFTVGSALVNVRPVAHVGATNGYRIETTSGALAYIPDHQQPVESMVGHKIPGAVMELCQGVDVLIHDAQYSEAEFALKSDWGHSSTAYALEVARQAEVSKLVLFHHDPGHSDAWIDAATTEAQVVAGDAFEVVAAAEGMRLEVGRCK